MARYIDADNANVEQISCFYGGECRLEDVQEWLDEQPTADVAEVRHGYWIPTNIPSYFGGIIYKCSLCEAKDGEHSSILGSYCWRCGAKMDGRGPM